MKEGGGNGRDRDRSYDSKRSLCVSGSSSPVTLPFMALSAPGDPGSLTLADGDVVPAGLPCVCTSSS